MNTKEEETKNTETVVDYCKVEDGLPKKIVEDENWN
jgi:hypothetical protein